MGEINFTNLKALDFKSTIDVSEPDGSLPEVTQDKAI